MLQITILHEEKTVKILEIKDVDSLTVLSQFDKEAGSINLEPLKEYVGESVLITHFNRINDCTAFDYEHVKTITDVDKNQDGFWYFQYE